MDPSRLPQAQLPVPQEVPQPDLDEDKVVVNGKVHKFWDYQILAARDFRDVKQHDLPLARIKRIMKVDGGAQMVSANTPGIMGKACEILIQQIAVRAWKHAQSSTRGIIKVDDVIEAVAGPDVPVELPPAGPVQSEEEEDGGDEN